jgi:hypothetical protein
VKAPNTIPEHLYNKLTYSKTITGSKQAEMDLHQVSERSPLWITGMFRSGTSFTARLLESMGMDLGPSQDLLQAKGSRAALNPDGFHENFLFMEWSLMAFNQMGAWGDNPPTEQALKDYKNANIGYEDFVYNAIVNVHDDRISNKDKSRILKKYYGGNLAQYLAENFQKNALIKNPHFCLLHPVLDDIFPKGKYLVIFRNPEHTVSSAQQVTPNANMDLYHSYYTSILKHPRAQFLDLDQLIDNPTEGISILAKTHGLTGDFRHLAKLVKSTKWKGTGKLPQNVLSLYEELKSKSIL